MVAIFFDPCVFFGREGGVRIEAATSGHGRACGREDKLEARTAASLVVMVVSFSVLVASLAHIVASFEVIVASLGLIVLS